MKQSRDVTLVQSKPLGLVWIDSSYPIVACGLKDMLKTEAQVYCGQMPPPEGDPTCIVLHLDATEDPAPVLMKLQTLTPEVPVVIFGARHDLPLARSALRAGASGFIHFGMQPSQIVRALKVASKGELVVPRDLLIELVVGEQDPQANVEDLTVRQHEILKLLVEGLTNAQIAGRLFLSESTVKQHLRAAYKLLKVRNRTEAAKLFQDERR